MAQFGASTYDSSGLSKFYSNVFMVMSIGLAITGAITFWLSHDETMMKTLFGLYHYMDGDKSKTGFHASAWWWIAAALELVMVLAISWTSFKSTNVLTGLLLFGIYSALNGVTLAPVIYACTSASVAKVFFITAGTFSVCALFGHTTKINLLPLGSFFLVGLVGLLIALIVNIFYHSPLIDFTISAVAVLLFAGLTAFDMQMLREVYNESDEDSIPGLVIYGALSMYLDFMNMFIHLLRIFGVANDD